MQLCPRYRYSFGNASAAAGALEAGLVLVEHLCPAQRALTCSFTCCLFLGSSQDRAGGIWAASTGWASLTRILLLLLPSAFLFPSPTARGLLGFPGWRGGEAATALLFLGFNAHSFEDRVHLLHVVQVAADLQATRVLLVGKLRDAALSGVLQLRSHRIVRLGFSSERLKERGLKSAGAHQ